MELNKKLHILVVDDSATVRQGFTKILEKAPFIENITVASDPIFAMEKMEKEWPDVIILDIEMPRMDGVTFLKKLMGEHPTPVIICSSLTQEGTDTAMQAMAHGAVEIITKP
ncbi:MAG: response regulator, partial [Spirochaetia bacterium]|nr:response regulator [Spirochaetia bacterium]